MFRVQGPGLVQVRCPVAPKSGDVGHRATCVFDASAWCLLRNVLLTFSWKGTLCRPRLDTHEDNVGLGGAETLNPKP